jgi:hypothetical protein
MRVATGVILIIAAVINLFAALGYLVLGGAGKMTSYVAERSEKQGRELTDQQKESFAQMKQITGDKGGALLGLGVFYLVTVGTSIAGAVCLFRRKAVTLILVSGALAITAELLGGVVLKAALNAPIGFGKILASSLGLLGGVLAIVSALQLKSANASAADSSSAAAPM